MEKVDRTPTLAECIALQQEKDALSAQIAELEIEYVGLQASVAYLREAQYKLRVMVANLCYDMSQIFEITGIMADTERTHEWPLIKNALEKK